MSANSKQVAGSHYSGTLQHWDVVHQCELDYFQGNITKYVFRWKKKNGVEDLKKAAHYLQKYIELAERDMPPHHDDGEPTSGYVNQD